MSYNTNTNTDYQESTNNLGMTASAASPSRSLSSASPPAAAMNGTASMLASAASPLPEENPEYLKELQAEKDSLELSVNANSESNLENGENKTNHALKLLEQGKLRRTFLFKERTLFRILRSPF